MGKKFLRKNHGAATNGMNYEASITQDTSCKKAFNFHIITSNLARYVKLRQKLFFFLIIEYQINSTDSLFATACIGTQVFQQNHFERLIAESLQKDNHQLKCYYILPIQLN